MGAVLVEVPGPHVDVVDAFVAAGEGLRDIGVYEDFSKSVAVVGGGVARWRMAAGANSRLHAALEALDKLLRELGACLFENGGLYAGPRYDPQSEQNERGEGK